MKQSEIITVVVNSLPSAIQELDLESERDAIRFTWKGSRFRVSDSLSVSEVDGGLLKMCTTVTILMEQLLNMVNRTGL